jgi:hypothetical protein
MALAWTPPTSRNGIVTGNGIPRLRTTRRITTIMRGDLSSSQHGTGWFNIERQSLTHGDVAALSPHHFDR